MALTWLDPLLIAGVDTYYRLVPRPAPSPQALAKARIISHRGERQASDVIENSFAAFDPLPGKVFGLECDVRFTRDLVPVVFHDADLLRVLGTRERLCDLDWATLRQRFPQIPRLRELLERYAGRIHLMIEFKAEPRPQPQVQLQTLRQELSILQPRRDFHALSLDTATLDWLRPAFGECLVAIARSNVEQMSRYALVHRCAALTGHYALLSRNVVQRHHGARQNIGVGFPTCRNSLRFALSQGTQWVFSNDALKLQNLLEREKNLSKA